MRLRQLGTTQSVVFLAPPEVHQSILDVCKLRAGAYIDSSHVITWLLEQTCRANEQLQSLYLAQGSDFCRRTNAQWKHGNLLGKKAQRASFLEVIQLEERKTLEQLYGKIQSQPILASDMVHPTLRGFMRELSKENRVVAAKQRGYHSSALEEVEQEQEVFLQVEEVRTVKKPVRYQGLTFPGLHPSISLFAVTGVLSGETGYEHAFATLAKTTIGQKYDVRRTTSRLFVSTEFTRTISTEGKRHPSTDGFLVSPPISLALMACFSSYCIVLTETIAACGVDPLESFNRDGSDHYPRRGRAFDSRDPRARATGKCTSHCIRRSRDEEHATFQ